MTHAEWDEMLELGADECHCPPEVMKDALSLMMPTIRAAIIEECALLAERRAREGCGPSGIIDAIRALKEKP